MTSCTSGFDDDATVPAKFMSTASRALLSFAPMLFLAAVTSRPPVQHRRLPPTATALLVHTTPQDTYHCEDPSSCRQRAAPANTGFIPFP
ncbi:hypothetical protein CCHR01_08625 [Colletotrichum chrysophilum]|uniref:Uncharacterized protein n=1 Tax=Colletotrichum chrysophilum TaxID=1836956 RepID=A0AAD9AJW0_9PEZI|nr:hypothetical protein CCHR01_08625 [Colletotrichum chrysophilum]